jgi:acyl-CoA thioesterase
MNDIGEFFKGDRFAARNDIELIEVGPGCAKARMTLHPHHLNTLGIVHGGAIFTLADFAFAAASNSHGTAAVALNVNITFIKAARGGSLWADARELSRNARVGTYAIEVRDAEGDLVAEFQGLAYRKKERLPFAPPE